MSDFYDKTGKPITMTEWGQYRREGQDGYRRVASTTLRDGTWISTVWVGVVLGFGDEPPLIFETMVFPNGDNMRDLDRDHYATEEEALKGHERMVERWKKGEQE